MPTITPFLWFDGQAEQAMNFYLRIFPNGKVTHVSRSGSGAGAPVQSVTFELEGQRFMGFNGGPVFGFTPAISFFVQCESQAEVDHHWNGLLDGGEPARCGWLKDRFGISWQIVPRQLGELLQDPDRTRANRVLQAMMAMVKLDIAALVAARDAA